MSKGIFSSLRSVALRPPGGDFEFECWNLIVIWYLIFGILFKGSSLSAGNELLHKFCRKYFSANN